MMKKFKAWLKRRREQKLWREAIEEAARHKETMQKLHVYGVSEKLADTYAGRADDDAIR